MSRGVIHGQMSETTLENILYQFIEGEYDVLVTTTIIETGVDIPNVNTLFSENADHMGLLTVVSITWTCGTYKPYCLCVPSCINPIKS